MQGKTLMQAMADGDDLSRTSSGEGSKSEPSDPNAPKEIDISSGKPLDLEPTVIPHGTFNPEELKTLLTPEPKGPDTTQKNEPKPIPGSNFMTAEDAVEAFKTGQRTIARKDEEINQLRNQIEKEMPLKVRAQVQEELEKLLKATPPQESEEEKALKMDDPDAYRVLMLEKKISKQDADMQNLQGMIDEIKQVGKAKDVASEFHRVAADKKIPANLLFAYGSLREYADVSAEDLADIVIKDMADQGIKLSQADPDPKPVPVTVTDTAGLRSPVTAGSAASPSNVIDIESVGEIGSPGWKKLRKKMIDVAFNRLQGGAQ